MTREESIKEITNHLKHWKRLKEEKICSEADGENAINAFKMAIQALEQQPCEDCVSRQAVRDTIFAECSGTKLDIDFAKVLLLQRAIKALPSVTTRE